MPEFQFGDLICYNADFAVAGASWHDGPLMYVGPCGHPYGRNDRGEMTGLIDILDLELNITSRPHIDHKAPDMWRLCTHYLEAP